MRLALLAAFLFAVPAGAVMPFSWQYPFFPDPEVVIVPQGMTWHVEWITGYALVGSQGGSTPPPVVQLLAQDGGEYSDGFFIVPSLIDKPNVGYDYRNSVWSYSQPFSARVSGALSVTERPLAQSQYNGNIQLAIHGYLMPTLAGDYSGDGVANAADYTVLRDNASSWEPSDMVGWRTNYGTSIAEADSVTIPEPTTLALAAMLFSGLGVVRRRA